LAYYQDPIEINMEKEIELFIEDSTQMDLEEYFNQEKINFIKLTGREAEKFKKDQITEKDLFLAFGNTSSTVKWMDW
jgi:hypothetical protein